MVIDIVYKQQKDMVKHLYYKKNLYNTKYILIYFYTKEAQLIVKSVKNSNQTCMFLINDIL